MIFIYPVASHAFYAFYTYRKKGCLPPFCFVILSRFQKNYPLIYSDIQKNNHLIILFSQKK